MSVFDGRLDHQFRAEFLEKHRHLLSETRRVLRGFAVEGEGLPRVLKRYPRGHVCLGNSLERDRRPA
jgi:hypothetical protein